jgi:hypothetical protein
VLCQVVISVLCQVVIPVLCQVVTPVLCQVVTPVLCQVVTPVLCQVVVPVLCQVALLVVSLVLFARGCVEIMCCLSVSAHLDAKKAGELSTLFDVGGIVGMFPFFS